MRTNTEIYLDVYWEHVEKDNIPLAEITLLKALVKDSANPALYYEFCKLKIYQERLEAALDALEMVEKLEPNYRDTREGIVMLQKKIASRVMSQQY